MKNKILLADEDESVRRMVARVLEATGYTVVLARTGREAVRLSEEAQPDLVLLEVGRADSDHWEPVEEMRRLAPATPLIGITAWPNPAEPALPRALDAFMEKPLDLALLLKTIERLLSVAAGNRRGNLNEVSDQVG